jgi:MFS family permease
LRQEDDKDVSARDHTLPRATVSTDYTPGYEWTALSVTTLGALLASLQGSALLIFFLQGPYGQDPLTAGLMMAPFGLAFMLIGPLSGYLSDHHGARVLGTVGLLISAVGLLGLSTVTNTTPFWQLAIWMAVMGGGSGFFNSPNTNVIMTSVRSDQRGVAAGIRTMLSNTGQMLSISIAFPLVLSHIPQDVMMKIFIYGGGLGQNSAALATFLGGLHQAFLISCGLSVVAAIISALQPAHSPRAAAQATRSSDAEDAQRSSGSVV